jgi:catechol 2,3-dioxygenase-like lactoylglutathione lyase family enzyme
MIMRIWNITFTVSDLVRSVEFYGDVLGIVKKYQFPDYAGFDCGGVEIGLKTWGEREAVRQGEPILDLMVADIDAAWKNLRGKGVVFEGEPMETAWGSRFVQFRDPDGHLLQLVQIDWPRYFKANA